MVQLSKLSQDETNEASKEVPKEAPISLQIQSVLNTVNHVMIGLTATYFTSLASRLQFKDTAMHVFLTTIGFHVLAAEALMSHYNVNPLTNRFSHRTKSKIHGSLQFVGGSMALLGAVGKMSQTKVHFTTLHGKIGLVTTIMCAGSIVGGLLTYFQPKFVRKVFSSAELKYRHNFFGIITFTLAMGTIGLGYRTKFVEKVVPANTVPVLVTTTALVYLMTIVSPVKSLMERIKYRKDRKAK